MEELTPIQLAHQTLEDFGKIIAMLLDGKVHFASSHVYDTPNGKETVLHVVMARGRKDALIEALHLLES